MTRSSEESRLQSEPEEAPTNAAAAPSSAGWGSARWRVPLLVAVLVLLAGLFLGFSIPHRPVAGLWVVMLLPLFLALDMVLRHAPARGLRRWLLMAACTLPAGMVTAAVTGGWVVNTAHVYGFLPLPLAHAANILGFGAIVGLEFLLFLGVPFVLSWRRPALALVLVTLWATVGQLLPARFLMWSYGQTMVSHLPLVQFASLLGPGGLNLLYVPLQLALYAWVRSVYAPSEVPRRGLIVLSGVLVLGFGVAWMYGSARLQAPPETEPSAMAKQEANGQEANGQETSGARSVVLAGIQPNFSLGRLASNPELSHSDRERSLVQLLLDSEEALEQAQQIAGQFAARPPVLLVWPESVYPAPYFVSQQARRVVEAWLSGRGAELILATADYRVRRGPTGVVEGEVFGAAVHVGPDGLPKGLYHKMVLIPWGETIPLGDVIPGFKAALKRWIPNISDFTPGTDYTVFRLQGGLGVAPMICFDATREDVARGMAANGARLGLVMSNLAWFGRTSISQQFGWYVRFRAIENGIPMVQLSQNGESLIYDSRGRIAPTGLPQFERGVLVQRFTLPQHASFYAHNGGWINALWWVGLALTVLAGWRRPLLGAALRLLQRLRPRSGGR